MTLPPLGRSGWTNRRGGRPGVPYPTGMSRMLPRVAIVIPTRDRPQFLGDAIASVTATAAASDRHGGCATIVVDNSSTPDQTAAARAVAEDHGATFLVSSPAGVSRARNLGLRSADADFVSFLDDDDAYHPRFLDVTLGLFEEHPDAAVAFGRPTMCDAALEPVYEPSPKDLPAGDAFVFSAGSIVSWGGALARRSILVDIGGFDDEVAQSEDWDLQMRVAAEHDFVGSNEVVQLIRQHDRGIMTHHAWVSYLRECQIVERRGLQLTGRQGRQLLRRRAMLLRLRGRDAYDSIEHAGSARRRGETGEAARFVLTAFRRSPVHALKAAVNAVR